MPVANRHHLTGSVPANGQSAFAARIAAHEQMIETPCPTDGKIYPPPRPKHPVRERISARLRREERHRQQIELAIEMYGDLPPDTKGVSDASI
jgi:hypothetical protein